MNRELTGFIVLGGILIYAMIGAFIWGLDIWKTYKGPNNYHNNDELRGMSSVFWPIGVTVWCIRGLILLCVSFGVWVASPKKAKLPKARVVNTD